MKLPRSLPILLPLLPASLSAALFTDGHIDAIGIGYEGGELEPHTHVEFGTIDGATVGEGEYEAGELTVLIPYSTEATSSGGTIGTTIGAPSGTKYWVLPQSSTVAEGLNPEAPFLGIGAEELTPADWDGPISITLTGKTGPGEFALAQDVLGTLTFYMATEGGIDAADAYDMPAGGHEHFMWYFTEPGEYELSFDFEGTYDPDGPGGVDGVLEQASASYNFLVVPEPSTALLAALGGLGLLRRRRS